MWLKQLPLCNNFLCSESEFYNFVLDSIFRNLITSTARRSNNKFRIINNLFISSTDYVHVIR